MKKIITLMILSLMTTVELSFAQCNAMSSKGKGISQLSPGFTFIKSYLLDGGKENAQGEIEYSFVFSKGTAYMLTLVNNIGKSDNIEIKLYDPAHKLLVTNYDKKSDKYFPVVYPCKSTGVHYMTFKFSDGSEKCGLSVLGFKR